MQALKRRLLYLHSSTTHAIGVNAQAAPAARARRRRDGTVQAYFSSPFLPLNTRWENTV